MKKIYFFTILFLTATATVISAHEIIIGQSYEYEWQIINIATGAEISSGSGIVVPATSRGYRDIIHYIRSAVLGWNSPTRNVGGVRQRLIITANCCAPGNESAANPWVIR